MGVRLILRDNELRAVLGGEIDHHTARSLREEIDETATRTKPTVLTLDFSNVQFMDSSGVGLILGRCKLMQLWSGKVRVANLPEKLEKIVSLAGLQDVCTTIKDVETDETDE